MQEMSASLGCYISQYVFGLIRSAKEFFEGFLVLTFRILLVNELSPNVGKLFLEGTDYYTYQLTLFWRAFAAAGSESFRDYP